MFYAAGMGALSGTVSFESGRPFAGALEPIGTFVSGEATVSLGLMDFGIRQFFMPDSASASETGTVTNGVRHGGKHRSAPRRGMG